MIDFEYAARHLRGVWHLAAGDENWREEMDLTLDGIFRSLWAIVLAFPFALLGLTAVTRAAASTPDYADTVYSKAPLGVLLGIEIITLATAWVLSIAILAFSARHLGASKHTAGVIVMYNWSQLMGGIVASIPAIALIVTGSLEIFFILIISSLIFSLYLAWNVVRKTLLCKTGVTIAIIAIIIAIELGINSVVTGAGLRLYQLFS